MAEEIPAALTIHEGELVFRADGHELQMKISNLIQQADPQSLLLWANLLMQRDALMRLGAVAHGLSELAGALRSLIERPKEKVDTKAAAAASLELAKELITGLGIKLPPGALGG